MASIKKGRLTATPSNAAFWKHLREWKRVFWKREKTARLTVLDQSRDC